MLTFCFFAFCAPGQHSGRRNRMAQLGERRAECRGQCPHRPAAYGNVPGRDKAAKAPPASFHSATSPRCGELAEPARPEGLCPFAAITKIPPSGAHTKLLWDFCSSVQEFASQHFLLTSGSLQIFSPHVWPPCLRLTLPTAKRVVVFHHLAVAHAGHT